MKQQIKNTSDLRKMLIDVISDVRAGNLDYRDAGAIASLSSQILKSAKLDLEVKNTDTKNLANPITSALLIEDNSENSDIKENSNEDKVSNSSFINEERKNKILKLKADGDSLHLICDKVRANSSSDKKAVAAVFYNKSEEI